MVGRTIDITVGAGGAGATNDFVGSGGWNGSGGGDSSIQIPATGQGETATGGYRAYIGPHGTRQKTWSGGFPGGTYGGASISTLPAVNGDVSQYNANGPDAAASDGGAPYGIGSGSSLYYNIFSDTIYDSSGHRTDVPELVISPGGTAGSSTVPTAGIGQGASPYTATRAGGSGGVYIYFEDSANRTIYNYYEVTKVTNPIGTSTTYSTVPTAVTALDDKLNKIASWINLLTK
jgi:hypothetical protein